MKLNKNIENYDPRTYFDYLKLGDVNTKSFLMIAELIDNSISSFEKKYGNKWKEKLIINIKTNFEADVKDINGYKVLNKSFISFVDNGFGMKKEELRNAVKLNARNHSTSKMNVHGRGLKQCAFFFGVDLSIKTSGEDGDWIIEQKLSDQDSDNAPYYIDPKKGESAQRGTEILIENIRENKAVSFNTWKRIKETLEFRYIKYFQKDMLEINYQYNKEETGQFELPNEPMVLVSQSFESTSYDDDKFQGFLNRVEKNVDNEIKHRAAKVYSTTVKSAFQKMKELFLKSREDNTTLFNFELDIKVGEVELPVTFWMLPKNKAKYRGIRLFEGERAINHAGYQELETKPYMNWKHGRMETGSTENSFAGQCDLSLLGVKSKTDKSSFTISEDMLNEFDKRIFSVWVAFNAFTLRSRKEIKNSKGSKPSLTSKRALEAVVTTKFSEENIKLIDEDKKDYPTFQYESQKGVLWRIEIRVEEKPRPKLIFSKDEDEDENILSIKVFTAHLFWNNMNKLKEDFYTEAIVPISLLVAFQYIDLKEGAEGDPIDVLNLGGEKFK